MPASLATPGLIGRIFRLAYSGLMLMDGFEIPT
jgi:hypothetical protein